MGIPMGCSDVHRRHGYPLGADELEAPLPSLVQRNASMADGDRSMYRRRHYLSVHHRRRSTIYLLPILA